MRKMRRRINWREKRRKLHKGDGTKVARVEYWNALPEAISVRCPPLVLLSRLCCFAASILHPLSHSLSFLVFQSSLSLPPSFAFLYSIYYLNIYMVYLSQHRRFSLIYSKFPLPFFFILPLHRSGKKFL